MITEGSLQNWDEDVRDGEQRSTWGPRIQALITEVRRLQRVQTLLGDHLQAGAYDVKDLVIRGNEFYETLLHIAVGDGVGNLPDSQVIPMWQGWAQAVIGYESEKGDGPQPWAYNSDSAPEGQNG